MTQTKSTTVYTALARHVTIAADMDITPVNVRRAAKGERQQKGIPKEAKAKASAKEVRRIIHLTKVKGKDKKKGAKERVNTKAKERRKRDAGHVEVHITIAIDRKEEEEKGAAKEG